MRTVREYGGRMLSRRIFSVVVAMLLFTTIGYAHVEPATVEWEMTFGGENGDDGQCVRQTTDGGYIVAGSTAPPFGEGPSDVLLLKFAPARHFIRGDCNSDGIAEGITDAVYLLNYLFLGGLQPPAPFPECGLDPTIDELTCTSFESCAEAK